MMNRYSGENGHSYYWFPSCGKDIDNICEFQEIVTFNITFKIIAKRDKQYFVDIEARNEM